jgi:hypothetical protein
VKSTNSNQDALMTSEPVDGCITSRDPRKTSSEGSPSGLVTFRARPVRIEDRLGPGVKMQMPGRPDQHGERHGKIVMPSGRAFIDHGALVLLGFERHKLLTGAYTFRTLGKADPFVAQLGE